MAKNEQETSTWTILQTFTTGPGSFSRPSVVQGTAETVRTTGEKKMSRPRFSSEGHREKAWEKGRLWNLNVCMRVGRWIPAVEAGASGEMSRGAWLEFVGESAWMHNGKTGSADQSTPLPPAVDDPLICDALNAGLLPPRGFALENSYSSALYPECFGVAGSKSKTFPVPRRDDDPRSHSPQDGSSPRQARHERANRVVIRHHWARWFALSRCVAWEQGRQDCPSGNWVEGGRLLRSGNQPLSHRSSPRRPQDPHTLHKLLWDAFDERAVRAYADEPSCWLHTGRHAPVMEIHSGGVLSKPLRRGERVARNEAGGHRSDVTAARADGTEVAWEVCPSDFRIPRRTRRTAGRDLLRAENHDGLNPSRVCDESRTSQAIASTALRKVGNALIGLLDLRELRGGHRRVRV